VGGVAIPSRLAWPVGGGLASHESEKERERRVGKGIIFIGAGSATQCTWGQAGQTQRFPGTAKGNGDDRVCFGVRTKTKPGGWCMALPPRGRPNNNNMERASRLPSKRAET